MILIIVIVVVLVLLVLFFMSSYNKLVRLSNRVDEGFSTMDVYLKKRFDLIPNLVETVKGYAKHEADTLSSVIAQRNMAKTSKITNAIHGIFAVAEQYPDLKANTNFMDLQNQLKKVEEDIANSRKYYNALVREYNDVIMSVPTNIVASLFHFEKKTMFEVANASERENVQVKF
jgi:LemA protein